MKIFAVLVSFLVSCSLIFFLPLFPLRLFSSYSLRDFGSDTFHEFSRLSACLIRLLVSRQCTAVSTLSA